VEVGGEGTQVVVTGGQGTKVEGVAGVYIHFMWGEAFGDSTL